jgi:hypothetical protein
MVDPAVDAVHSDNQPRQPALVVDGADLSRVAASVDPGGDMDDDETTCPGCGEPRAAADFPARGTRCLDCRRAAGRAHYRANRDYYLAKARRRTVRVVLETRVWLVAYLRSHPCVDCGHRDIRVLEFDHRDGTTKQGDVSVLASEGFGLARVRAEVAKCDVRCAICHRIRTHIQRGWWGKNLEPEA